MSAALESDYRLALRMGSPQRSLAWLLIAGLHLGALAALIHLPAESAPLAAPQAMMVSFISEPAPPKVAPPPPEPPPPPKPLPKLVATPKPTPSAMKAPLPEEQPVVEDTMVAESPPAPPQPATPAPTAEPVVVPPNFVAAYLNNPGPAYPYLSKQRREQGTVMLRVLVSAAGRADQVLIDRSSGHSRLDEAAQDVVLKRWRFVPARQGEDAVSAWVLVPIQFELKG